MSKIDLLFSEDGDMRLGAPKTNEDGELLYLYKDGTVSTESMIEDKEGKLIRDFAYSIGRNAYKQIIINRLKTEAPDWFKYPNMGGNLTDLIGEPNTKATGELGAERIVNALTYGGLFSVNDISVRAVPISLDEILFRITVQSKGAEPYVLPLVFDLNYGLKEV